MQPLLHHTPPRLKNTKNLPSAKADELNDKIRVEERSQESIATQKQQYKKR
jgi:hypothetical protein